MRDPFTLLDLPPDADERAIKRAYAARLRTTRPDEDPEDFQRLNEAYQTALGMLRHRLAQEQFAGARGTGDSGQEASVEPAVVDETATHASQDDVHRDSSGERATGTIGDEAGDVADDAPQGEAITLDQFLDACLGAASDGDPRVLEHWLRSQPVLWSLEHKAMIGHWLLRLMDARQPPMTDRNFDMLAEFFGYNDLHAGYDPLAMQRLREQLNNEWGRESFAASRQQAAESAFLKRILKLQESLGQPVKLPRNLLQSLNVFKTGDLREMLLKNPYGGADQLPDEIHPTQIAFWLAATDDSRWTSIRIRVALLRCVALSLPAAPILFFVLNNLTKLGFIPMLLCASVAPFLAFFLAWLSNAIAKDITYWQSNRPDGSLIGRYVHMAFVPALSCTGAVLLRTVVPPWIALLLAMIACCGACGRYSGRRDNREEYSISSFAQPIVALCILSSLSLLSMLKDITHVAVALIVFNLGLWSFDALHSWKHR
jgi:hypothetical protein